MKFNRWTLSIAIFTVAIAMVATAPPGLTREADVGAMENSEVQNMDANPATMAPMEVDAIGMEIVAIPANESAAIPEVATIMTYSSAVSEKIDATWTTTVNISAQGALVHSPALFVDQQFASAKSHVFHQEGGDAASGAWLVIRC